jgi:hypothetical protein
VVVEVGVFARLPVEPAWFVQRVAGLRIVFGLVYTLSVLTYLISLVIEPLGLMYLFLVLVYLIFSAFELFKLVSLDFSLVLIFISPWYVLVVSVVIRFGVGWVWVVVD